MEEQQIAAAANADNAVVFIFLFDTKHFFYLKKKRNSHLVCSVGIASDIWLLLIISEYPRITLEPVLRNLIWENLSLP